MRSQQFCFLPVSQHFFLVFPHSNGLVLRLLLWVWKRKIVFRTLFVKEEVFFFLNYLFMYYWLHQIFVALCGLSLVRASGGCSLVVVRGLLIVVAALAAEHRLEACGLQQLRLPGPGAQAQQLWHMQFVVPQHVGSSRTRDQTGVSRPGRLILNHCTTREVPEHCFNCFEFDSVYS